MRFQVGYLTLPLKLEHHNSCRSRAAAIEAARQEFGRERFDRFLYEAMTPGTREPHPPLAR